MAIDVRMPALSPSMEKGNLIQWVKAVGDTVRIGDVLAEVETDKATMDVEATAEGVLARIVVAGGTQDVPINQLIGLIAPEGEGVETVSGPSDEVIMVVASVEAVTPSATASREEAKDDRVFASPIARRLIAEAALDVAAIMGTGPRGRIVERDVKAALAARDAAAAVSAPQPLAPAHVVPSTATGNDAAPIAARGADIRQMFSPGGYDELPHDAMRLTIARRLTEAKRTVPHFYLGADCEMDALLALRAQFNADGGGRYKLSVNDFVIRALALALAAVPDANVSFAEDAMLRHRHADIGVAVAIPGGLVTPVVRRAETKTLSTISGEMQDLAERARTRKLKPEEYQGGTAGLSNLGMYGIASFSAILNPPQATILAVGAAERRLVVRDDAAAVATMMTVTLSVDHRAVDGATAARLLAAFKALVERPLAMVV